jgi:hypothetical protein
MNSRDQAARGGDGLRVALTSLRSPESRVTHGTGVEPTYPDRRLQAKVGEVPFSEVAVASDPPDATVSTPQRQGGTPSASKRSDYVAFVAPLCSKRLRLAAAQLPENFSSTGPRPNGTSG